MILVVLTVYTVVEFTVYTCRTYLSDQLRTVSRTMDYILHTVHTVYTV